MSPGVVDHYRMPRRELTVGVHHYRAFRGDHQLSYGEVLALWQGDEAFVDCFAQTMVDTPFSAYRWETPPIRAGILDLAFEYVLLDAPYLQGAADRAAYARYFSLDEQCTGVVVFDNLGRDATLIAPTPTGSDYPHLAQFMRSAPVMQIRALWRTVADTALARLSDRPLWISTAGGGVYWLHVRLDARPKYYGHQAYRSAR